MKLGLEMQKCGKQVKFMWFSFFLLALALIVSMTISTDDMLKMTKAQQMKMMGQTVPPEQMPSQDAINKVLVSSILVLIASVVLFVSILFAVSKGCFKASMYGLLFGLLTGLV